MEVIDPERLTLGNVLRKGSSIRSAFDDAVIIGIHVSFGDKKVHFLTLDSAQKAASNADYIAISLARPYLYASNAFGSIPNWLTGVERYEVVGSRDVFTRRTKVVDTHRVVVMSTGEYACYMAQPTLHKWSVVVGNQGKVYDDLEESGARATYKIYRQMSQGAFGRSVGGTVTLWRDDELVEEYVGTERDE